MADVHPVAEVNAWNTYLRTTRNRHRVQGDDSYREVEPYAWTKLLAALRKLDKLPGGLQ